MTICTALISYPNPKSTALIPYEPRMPAMEFVRLEAEKNLRSLKVKMLDLSDFDENGFWKEIESVLNSPKYLLHSNLNFEMINLGDEKVIKINSISLVIIIG